MPRKKPGVSMSDRDVLRHRPSMSATGPVDDEGPPVDDLGDTEESIIRAMNGVFRDLSTGRISKDSADPMISAARVTLNAVKSRDAKQKIAMLEKLLQQAKDVANAGLAREAADRHHVTRADDSEAEADAEEEDDGDE